MTLGEQQRLFGKLLPRLLDKAQELYPDGVVVGEVERGAAQAAANAASGKGILRSLHLSRLAVDLHLFREISGTWVYMTSNEDHRALGEWWETQHPLARWGGRFGDGNHYSLEYGGRK